MVNDIFRLCLVVAILIGTILIYSSCTDDHLKKGCLDTGKISFHQQVQPIITQYCATLFCHSPANASSVLTISNYAQVMLSVNDIRNRIFTKTMPVGAPLSDCQINSIVKWVDQGALNN